MTRRALLALSIIFLQSISAETIYVKTGRLIVDASQPTDIHALEKFASLCSKEQ